MVSSTPRAPALPLRATVLVAAIVVGMAPAAAADVTLKAMARELDRSMRALADRPTPPYYLSYEIVEDRVVSVKGAFGSLTRWSETASRTLDIDLRVGDYNLDNTHPVRGARPFQSASLDVAPVGNDEALRSVLWYWTDKRYKQALERLTVVKTNVKVNVKEEDTTGDFSPAKAEKFEERRVPLEVDRAAWEEKVRAYTAPFQATPHVYGGSASLLANVETRWYVNSDGSRIKVSQPYYRLTVSASTKAEDGMNLPRFQEWFAFTPAGLPADSEVLTAVAKITADLAALRAAPLVDPYTGPAILSGAASGVFFHEILGHRLEGHRQKLVDESQTFKRMVGESVLPEAFSVIFDPTATRVGGVDLMGAYRYDNQGVKARRVPVIERGVLANFLMSRMPIKGFARSNGHGRKNVGHLPVARQSNLLVEVANPVPRAELEARLLAMIEAQGKSFGLYFEDIQGGFTTTRRLMPNAFNVNPVLVYRMYRDGAKELVRGVDLIGTPLTAFSKIVAGGTEVAVFNGICGAESGSVPVAAVSPALLVSQIEVQKKGKSQDRAPILAPPGATPRAEDRS